jgi:hypothetical protein
MHVKIEKAAAWSTLGMLVIFGIAMWGIGRLIPPISPGLTAEQTAHFYLDHDLRIRIGLGILVAGMWFMTPVFALLSRQVRRIEGYWGVMSLTVLILSVTFPFVFTLAMVFGVAAAYRPDRDPQVVQGLSDMFWLLLVGIVGPLVLQGLMIALAVFVDKRAVPTFPRWYGYLNLWMAVLVVPGGAVYFFKTGPLAWNGIIAWWIPVSAFFVWIVPTVILLVKAIDIEAAEREQRASSREWEPAA